jgi:hypothetical protein
MKITKEYLKGLINEELTRLQEVEVINLSDKFKKLGDRPGSQSGGGSNVISFAQRKAAKAPPSDEPMEMLKKLVEQIKLTGQQAVDSKIDQGSPEVVSQSLGRRMIRFGADLENIIMGIKRRGIDGRKPRD